MHVNTLEGFWSPLRCRLRPHRGISQGCLPLNLGLFEFVHDDRAQGERLLGALTGRLLAPPCTPSRALILGGSPVGPVPMTGTRASANRHPRGGSGASEPRPIPIRLLVTLAGPPLVLRPVWLCPVRVTPSALRETVED